jgi:hypothetical protein
VCEKIPRRTYAQRYTNNKRKISFAELEDSDLSIQLPKFYRNRVYSCKERFTILHDYSWYIMLEIGSISFLYSKHYLQKQYCFSLSCKHKLRFYVSFLSARSPISARVYSCCVIQKKSERVWMKSHIANKTHFIVLTR